MKDNCLKFSNFATQTVREVDDSRYDKFTTYYSFLITVGFG